MNESISAGAIDLQEYSMLFSFSPVVKENDMDIAISGKEKLSFILEKVKQET